MQLSLPQSAQFYGNCSPASSWTTHRQTRLNTKFKVISSRHSRCERGGTVLKCCRDSAGSDQLRVPGMTPALQDSLLSRSRSKGTKSTGSTQT